MRLLKRLFSLLCVFSCLSLAFLSMPFNASAYSGTLWTPQLSTLQGWLPSTISGGYLGTDGQMHSCSFTPYSGQTETLTSWDIDLTDIQGDWRLRPFVWYETAVPADLASNDSLYQPIFYIDLNLKFLGCEYAEMFCLAPRSTTYFNFPDSGNLKALNYGCIGPNVSDNSAYHYLLPRSGSNVPNYCTSNYNNYLSVCGGVYSGNSAGDVYFSTFQFSNFRVVVGKILVGILCPTLDSNAQFAGVVVPPSGGGGGGSIDFEGSGNSSGTVSGTITDNGSGSQSINVTVDMDNSGLIGGILSGIRNLFVPSDEALENFTDDMQGAFIGHLGGIPEALDLIDEQADYLRNAVSSDTFYVGQIRAPVGDNVYFELGGWDVELKPEYQRLHVLYDALPVVIDLIAVFSVLNMLRTKFDILLNPEGECITYDN